MKIESLEDILQIDHEKNKAAENKRLITKVKQLLKSNTKQEKKEEANADQMPYEAVSVVGNKLVKLKFDLETKEARVVDISVDSRDDRGRNHMARFYASKVIDHYAKYQKESE